MNESYQTIIVGGGISGLTIAHFLRRQHPHHRFALLEKSGRTGGAIVSHHEQGYIFEEGPHGFLDNCQESLKILTETGLDRECIKAPLANFVRYVRLHGKLNCIPQTPPKILMAPLIPWSAKLRVLTELWQPVLNGEPTVAKWINHRFGPALLPFADAVFTGTYAGDYDKLTIDSVMPGLRRLEKEHGSVLRGLFASLAAKRKRDKGTAPFTMPAMTSFPQGMQRLPEKLTEILTSDQNLFYHTAITALTPTKGGWSIETTAGPCWAKNVILALPLNSALDLLQRVTPQPPVKKIPEAWLATVVFGFDHSVTLPPGFGFLAPEVEQRFALGALFSSNMFPGRAPVGHAMIEVLVGGRRHPERLDLTDEILARQAFLDIEGILGLSSTPVFTKVQRTGSGIPQLETAYPELLAWRDALQHRYPNLKLCGFGWDGIGLNDMMKHATKVAAEIVQEKATAPGGAEVKGIYF